MIERADQSQASEEYNLEWVQMALILDRFFLYAFIVEFVLYTAIIFIQVGDQKFYEFWLIF